MKINVEKVKFIAEDNGWSLVEDRPGDYFCRFYNAPERKDARFTIDVYYSKKGSVRIKQKKGMNAYLRGITTDLMEDIFLNPYKYYKVSYTHLK